jgi:hypothetical protein
MIVSESLSGSVGYCRLPLAPMALWIRGCYLPARTAQLVLPSWMFQLVLSGWMFQLVLSGWMFQLVLSGWTEGE